MSSTEKPRYCAECGASLEGGDAFCLKCGSQTARFIPSAKHTRRRRVALALAILLGLSACVVAVAVGSIVVFPELLPITIPQLIGSSPATSTAEPISTTTGYRVVTPTRLPSAIAMTTASCSPIPRASPTGTPGRSPSPSPTSRPIRSPTPSPVSCDTVPAGALSLVWRQAASLRNTLGCPTELERTTWSVEEHFQYGYMYWREDISWIYVLYDDHTWQDFRDFLSRSEALARSGANSWAVRKRE